MKPGIITELPGPKSQELLKLKEQYVVRGYGNACSMFADRAEGALVQDLDGNVFVDFAGGIGILNTGHCPPEVVEVLKTQIERYLHTGHIVFNGTAGAFSGTVSPDCARGFCQKGNDGQQRGRGGGKCRKNCPQIHRPHRDYRFGMRFSWAYLHGHDPNQ